ncbi:helix-turn-helix transcriptional regulator [Acetobacter tropicalis]|uniref:helix-turn-helix transcriptional regulator n=1 Tax=Acetobacter tropicalis TaxID=104102 RepID=UPI0009EF1A4A|nr:helix-turn-helix domain-containing protein [Acetobacter tropicalis]
MKSQSEVSPLVIPEKQAAEMLGISRRTLQNLRIDGAGPPFVQITSRRVGYSLSALQEWIAARSVRSTTQATVRFGGAA